MPYPVLSVQSIEGARVEFALREIGTPQKFLEFHRKIYAGRGVIDGNRALAAAQAMGFDREKIIEAANTKAVTETMTRHAKLGSELKLWPRRPMCSAASPSSAIPGLSRCARPWPPFGAAKPWCASSSGAAHW